MDYGSNSLIDSLVIISNEVGSMEKKPLFVHARNVSTTIRRIKLYSSFFEEVQVITHTPLPPSSVMCFSEILSLITKMKLLIQECKDGSYLWGLIQLEFISNQFYVLAKDIGSAIGILPLKLLNITRDTTEQVELLQKQAKRVELFIDSRDLQLRDQLLHVMANNSLQSSKNNSKALVDFGKVEEILSNIGLRTKQDYDTEISKLEAEAQNQSDKGGLMAVSNINNLLWLISFCKSLEFRDGGKKRNGECKPLSEFLSIKTHDSSSSQSMTVNIRDEFRCPISLELMRDPVTVSSGHTYDRVSIAQWINAGHQTCPKSGQRLVHTALIPNYSLKSLVQQWCYENKVPVNEPNSSLSEINSSENHLNVNPVDHASSYEASADAVKTTAEFLVGKLATGSADIQRRAAYKLRLLAKSGMDNQRIIAEAGAIPFLVTLLGSNDPRIQEHAVTALLNLSIFDNNKILIMAAGAVENIVEVLESGKTMEARENAAAAIFSLSMVDDSKVTIGAHPRAIRALIRLLKEGTPTGKRDSATALFNLCNIGKHC